MKKDILRRFVRKLKEHSDEYQILEVKKNALGEEVYIEGELGSLIRAQEASNKEDEIDLIYRPLSTRMKDKLKDEGLEPSKFSKKLEEILGLYLEKREDIRYKRLDKKTGIIAYFRLWEPLKL